jgi:hypothetical protein
MFGNYNLTLVKKCTFKKLFQKSCPFGSKNVKILNLNSSLKHFLCAVQYGTKENFYLSNLRTIIRLLIPINQFCGAGAARSRIALRLRH